MKQENKDIVDGQTIFKLYETYGFPHQKLQQTWQKSKVLNDMTEFDKLFKEHQDKSRIGSEQKFKGGLADQNEQTIKYHTANTLIT